MCPPPGAGARHDPYAGRLVAPLQWDLVGVLERTEFDGLHPTKAEEQQDGQPEPLVDHDLAVDDLGDPHLAPVEEVDGLVDRGAGTLVVTLEAIPLLPQRLHPGGEVGHGRRLQAGR